MPTQDTIDNLTIRDARQIAALFGGAPQPSAAPATITFPEKPVLVTTAHRGVFFGYATEISGETIFLRAGQNCLYWPSSNKGFVGLAAIGPMKGARVGPAANMTLRNITSVVECTPEAAAAWGAFPWSE